MTVRRVVVLAAARTSTTPTAQVAQDLRPASPPPRPQHLARQLWLPLDDVGRCMIALAQPLRTH